MKIYPTSFTEYLYLRQWVPTYVAHTEVLSERIKILCVNLCECFKTALPSDDILYTLTLLNLSKEIQLSVTTQSRCTKIRHSYNWILACLIILINLTHTMLLILTWLLGLKAVKSGNITNYSQFTSSAKPDTLRRAFCSWWKWVLCLISQSKIIISVIGNFVATNSKILIDVSLAGENRRVRKYQTDFLTFDFQYQLVKGD